MNKNGTLKYMLVGFESFAREVSFEMVCCRVMEQMQDVGEGVAKTKITKEKYQI